MGTPHTKSGARRSAIVPVRFTEAAANKIDEHRGTWTRSEYVRRAVALAIQQGKKGPTPVAVDEGDIRW